MNIKTLEGKKAGILKELEGLGDMRTGTVSIRYQRCGKSPCACDDPKHQGHGPIYSYSTAVNGKTKIKNFKLGPELAKLQKELETYQKFKQLSKDLISISNRISELRPVQEIKDGQDLEALKKKLEHLFRKKSKKKLTR